MSGRSRGRPAHAGAAVPSGRSRAHPPLLPAAATAAGVAPGAAEGAAHPAGLPEETLSGGLTAEFGGSALVQFVVEQRDLPGGTVSRGTRSVVPQGDPAHREDAASPAPKGP